MPPLISIVTPVFNAARFLPRMIRSVQNQTEKNYEHIVVDDCSTDGGLAIIEAFAAQDQRIKIVKLPRNQGVIAARNAAIGLARGRYLAFLDADDLWLPEKLEIQSRHMMLNNIVLSYTDYRFISECGDKVGRLLRTPNRIGWHWHHMTRYLGCLTIMLDREKCPCFSFGEVSSKFRAEDFLAWSCVIQKHGPATRCPGDLARYAIVKNSRSSNGIVASLTVWQLYRKVENINLCMAGVYFASYILFSTAKRQYCKPVHTPSTSFIASYAIHHE